MRDQTDQNPAGRRTAVNNTDQNRTHSSKPDLPKEVKAVDGLDPRIRLPAQMYFLAGSVVKGPCRVRWIHGLDREDSVHGGIARDLVGFASDPQDGSWSDGDASLLHSSGQGARHARMKRKYLMGWRIRLIIPLSYHTPRTL